MRMHRVCFAIGLGVLFASVSAHAKDRPQLAPGASEALAAGSLFLPDDNLLVPIGGGKATSLLVTKPPRLLLVDHKPGELLIAIDKDVYRITFGGEAKLSRVASGIEASPAANEDASVIVSIEDKRILLVTRGEATDRIPYRRAGNWELENPYVMPDGTRALLTVRDYTQPLEVFQFLIVDLKSRDIEEVKLSQTFQPGPLRQRLGESGILMQMYANQGEEDGLLKLAETDFSVFDWREKKMAAAPAGTRPGRPSPTGKYSVLPGPMVYQDGKRCGADRSLVFGLSPRAMQWEAGAGNTVAIYGFTSDEQSLVADIFTAKTCKHKGVLIPLDKKVPQAKWKPIALPSHQGHLQGAVLLPKK